MKIAALLPLALAALLCACGAPACTSEVAGPSINYEAQFYHTTSGLFLQQQRSELAETDALLDRLSKLENTPEALAYLQGYLDGISGNVNGSLSACRSLWVYAPKETVPQMFPDGLNEPYLSYSDARTSFLRTLCQNCDNPLLTDPASPFRAKLPQLQEAFDQLYDLNVISCDWQAEKYAQDLDTFTQLLLETTALLDPNAVTDPSTVQ